MPTVLYSNTPHYDTIHGGAIPADWFAGYLKDLERRRALTATRAIILGYLGSAEQADILADWLDGEKARRPQLHISIDPVLGDHDSGLYVRPELAASYRDRLVACADLITPNHYELGYLSQRPTDDYDATVAAARSLLGDRLKTVIVTSSPGAWSTIGEQRIKLGPVTHTTDPHMQPGDIHVAKNRILVGTGTTPVSLGRVQPSGKKPMPAADWARGTMIEGKRFE